jgi:hypothetical protein
MISVLILWHCNGYRLLSFPVRAHPSFCYLLSGHHSTTIFIARTRRAADSPRFTLLSRPSTSRQLPPARPVHNQDIGRQSLALSRPSPSQPNLARVHHIPIFAVSPHTSIYLLRQQNETSSLTPKCQKTIPPSVSVSAAWFIQSHLPLHLSAPATAFQTGRLTPESQGLH